MNTNNRKKSVTAAFGAAVAALAAPAMLFLGTGTAQAGTLVTPETNALGVTVSVYSNTQSGWCKYSAWPTSWGAVKPLPVSNVPFHLQHEVNHQMWFPGIQTGSTWTAKTECEFGGTEFHPNLTY